MKRFTTFMLLILSLSTQAQSTMWYEIPTNTNKRLNTISFGSPAIGYIGGNDSLLLKTTDGGFTWSEVAMSGVNFFAFSNAILNLKFVNETIGYMTTQSSGVYKTTDGGSTWSQLPVSGNMCYAHGLFFWDEQNGLIGGAGCFQGEVIDIYTDGNVELATINPPTSDPADIVVDIDFLDSDFGLATSRSRFLRTTDGGQNWDTIPSGTPNTLTSIEIVNDTLAYAGYINDQTAGYGILVTHDGGLTWTMDFDMATFAYPDYNDVKETADGTMFTVGSSSFSAGMIFENTSEGWWYYDVSQPLFALDSYGDSTVFAVGDSGLVVTNINPVLSVFETTSGENPMTLYPNPADDVLYFDLGDENTGLPSTITVWNLQGQLVLQATVSDFKVNVSDLSAGSYVLEVVQNGRKFSRPFLRK